LRLARSAHGPAGQDAGGRRASRSLLGKRREIGHWNLRTTTLKVFSEAEYDKTVGAVS